jgi:hypothetical protein
MKSTIAGQVDNTPQLSFGVQFERRLTRTELVVPSAAKRLLS